MIISKLPVSSIIYQLHLGSFVEDTQQQQRYSSTERYFFVADTYFRQSKRAGSFHIYIKVMNRQIHEKVKDYRLKMYSMLNEWHKKEIEQNKEIVHIYSQED